MTDDLALFEAFFKKSKPYYLDKLTKYRNGQRFSFNVFAFLFGLFWFMYRKMYLEAIVVLVVIVAEGFLESLIVTNNMGQDMGKVVNIVATIAIGTIVGLSGNYFYLLKARKAVQVAKTKYIDKEQQEALLMRKGGVSFIFLIIIVILIILLFAYNNYMTNNGG